MPTALPPQVLPAPDRGLVGAWRRLAQHAGANPRLLVSGGPLSDDPRDLLAVRASRVAALLGGSPDAEVGALTLSAEDFRDLIEGLKLTESALQLEGNALLRDRFDGLVAGTHTFTSAGQAALGAQVLELMANDPERALDPGGPQAGSSEAQRLAGRLAPALASHARQGKKLAVSMALTAARAGCSEGLARTRNEGFRRLDQQLEQWQRMLDAAQWTPGQSEDSLPDEVLAGDPLQVFDWEALGVEPGAIECPLHVPAEPNPRPLDDSALWEEMARSGLRSPVSSGSPRPPDRPGDLPISGSDIRLAPEGPGARALPILQDALALLSDWAPVLRDRVESVVTRVRIYDPDEVDMEVRELEAGELVIEWESLTDPLGLEATPMDNQLALILAEELVFDAADLVAAGDILERATDRPKGRGLTREVLLADHTTVAAGFALRRVWAHCARLECAQGMLPVAQALLPEGVAEERLGVLTAQVRDLLATLHFHTLRFPGLQPFVDVIDRRAFELGL